MKSRRNGSAATLEDIGRELGVSAMTVSRALNGHPSVHEATRQKVLDYAQLCNYRPNRWARSLVTRTSKIIGVVVPDISHSFFSEVTRSFQEVIERYGYDLMLCHTHADSGRERAAIEMLLGSRADGLLVASTLPEDDPGIFLELHQSGMPFVLLDRYFPQLGCTTVRTDDREVGRIATQHLIDLGHRAIAHIQGPSVSVARLRFEGYRDAMTQNGLPIRDQWVEPSSFEFAGGLAAMSRLLACAPRPTAVFASNDPTALGAIHECRNRGLDVPGDISVIGAGSIEMQYHPNPFLTTIGWSTRELGEKAAELLLNSIANEPSSSASEWVSVPHLIARQSTTWAAPAVI
jgi:LacI family transcriptional regulator